MPRWLRGSDTDYPDASRDSLSSADPAGVESLDDWDDDEDAEDGNGPADGLEGQEWVGEPGGDEESRGSEAVNLMDTTPSDSMRESVPPDVARSSTLARSGEVESDADDIVLVGTNPSGQSASVMASVHDSVLPSISIPSGLQISVLAPESERESGWEPLDVSSLPLREWPSPSTARISSDIERGDDDDDGDDNSNARLTDSEVTIAKRNRR
jgi:hypothetical protein